MAVQPPPRLLHGYCHPVLNGGLAFNPGAVTTTTSLSISPPTATSSSVILPADAFIVLPADIHPSSDAAYIVCVALVAPSLSSALLSIQSNQAPPSPLLTSL